jgi:hypothetical protein
MQISVTARVNFLLHQQNHYMFIHDEIDNLEHIYNRDYRVSGLCPWFNILTEYRAGG